MRRAGGGGGGWRSKVVGIVGEVRGVGRGCLDGGGLGETDSLKVRCP